MGFMRELTAISLISIVVSCSSRELNSGSVASQVPSPASPAEPQPSPSTSHTIAQNSPIRLVNFSNVSYPNYTEYRSDKKKRVTLMPGKASPAYLNYGDVTGDGIEEAMAVLGIDIRGSATPEYVYIFTVDKGQPKLIWDFETGDRADGGLRQVYADNGQLVIELFGKDRVIGGELYKGDEGLCCPSSYTRTRYSWTGKSFQQISKEVLANPRGDANPVMPSYHPPS